MIDAVAMTGRKRVRLILFGIGLLLAPIGPALAAPFEDGAIAFYRGDFTGALAAWRPLAEAGDARSQFNVGLLHERGLGTAKNDTEAVRWYQRSADQGYGEAQHKLGQFYAEGRGVARDPVQAYVWLTLAARTLGAGGTSRWIEIERNAIIRELSEEKRKEAEAIVLVWRPAPE